MEKFFGVAYRGDPGVPHCNGEVFNCIWIGSALYTGTLAVFPYFWTFTHRDNVLDRAILYENYHWRKALKKKEPYKFEWNKKSKSERENYYLNWPDFFE